MAAHSMKGLVRTGRRLSAGHGAADDEDQGVMLTCASAFGSHAGSHTDVRPCNSPD
jgi:hypothetical protein